MSFKFRALLTLTVTGALALTTGVLPAAASPTRPTDGSPASTPTLLTPELSNPSPGGTQVLVAEGEGWSIYAEAASAASVKVSQVQVAGSVTPMTVVDCGIITCSLYLSRAQTRQMNTNILAYGGGIAGLAASCGLFGLLTGPAAPIVVVACGVEIGVLGGFLLNAISRAAGDNGCLRIRYGALPTAFYDDHSSYCHNT